MKFQKSVFIVLIAASFLTACGSKDKKGDEKETETTNSGPTSKLEGSWEIKRATGGDGALDSMNIGTVYAFKGDSLTFGQGSFKNPGLTTMTDTSFSFQAIGNDLKFSYHYKMNGDTLVVLMDGSGQTFYMIKQ